MEEMGQKKNISKLESLGTKIEPLSPIQRNKSLKARLGARFGSWLSSEDYIEESAESSVASLPE
eukprot:Pgem_evm1s7601